ncbi:MAG: metallophosphoesterase family protein [bacterium]|nr:metallophosphoesterase family protein [bacterium]
MKLGIFADIHGNLYAFERIYEQLKKEACDLHLFLGDVCGYYYRQNEVIDILRDIPNLETIAGNHDVMFLETLKDESVMKNYIAHFGLSFINLRETITPRNLEFLKSLGERRSLTRDAFAAYHGSPWSPLGEYVYPDSPMERFDGLPVETVFLGHTHYPMAIERAGVRVVNPGSAGQPRDGGWPSYAVYHTETKETEIKRVPYNVAAQIGEVREKDDKNHYLIDVLQRIET